MPQKPQATRTPQAMALDNPYGLNVKHDSL